MNGQHRIGAVRSRPVMVLLAALCTSMKSSMSGKPYQVQCGAEEQMYSAAWMTTRLREVRAVQREALPKTN
ncbi:DUF5329 family protein [Polaromonas sp. UBA4122]|uniref:DUF5329 family protein n=1 Tax=Polaromonas sp. UBA4122 TaxID=1947074 RepID=UPI0025EAB14F|nr:DUF5329 family protein [Polaromonas sp. UBA4122]